LTGKSISRSFDRTEESIREYASGHRQKATLEWAVRVINSAIEKKWLSQEEVKGILLMVELNTSDAERRRRLDYLRKRLAS
jgi:hypothetical protein